MGAVLNLHRRSTSNVGDLRCAPYLYFPQLLGTDALDILGFRSADEPDPARRRAFKEAFAAAGAIIVGGGGLFEIDFFAPAFAFIAEHRRPGQKLIAWGAGHNAWTIGDWRKLKQAFTFSPDLFDLVGVRDQGYSLRWVPCVSCMSGAFDRQYAAARGVGLYVHAGTLKNEAFRQRLPHDIETLSNEAGFEEAIAFLGGSEIVLTDSFHGAYWATLLGRKVIAFPSSSKFYGLRHKVPLCSPEDWNDLLPLAATYPDALEECRDANRTFAALVAEMIGGDASGG
ncbi:polysaccharide pyruvyl transferase family protein [Neoroseomonas soli]|uniref:Polysaccharide pyruvyl transferase family protein n=1 Tax=Neoroseomonas soli TaxID=1081025 RepID=A0A9X9WUV2_9PROT|nr:polysaccharide pyruvyl transferase family protein [Neoroseomonas soli]MBR0670931.1 polysaccharide pyruvyl transferase family protein [Neoroseomonas soli]